MKKIFLISAVISLLCIVCKTSYSQTPSWLWAKSGGGGYYVSSTSSAVDTSGNIYVTGYFGSDTLSFDTYILLNDTNDSSEDMFLVKYDANGNVLWSQRAGGSSRDEATSVAVDVDGNAYVTGYFGSSSITFGSYTLINNATNACDIFVVKYSPTGNVLWAKRAGNYDDDIAWTLTTDITGNIYVAGSFASPSITFGSTTLTNTGVKNIFLVKYDSSGNVLWAKKEGGIDLDEAITVIVDKFGNIYMAGWFYSPTITFGSITLTNADNTSSSIDLFIVKYNSSGTVVWAKSASGADYDEYITSIAADTLGNLYIAGYYYSPVLHFSSYTLNNADISGNTSDIFLVKYNSSGNVNWVQSAGGNNYDGAFSVTVDISGNIIVGGGFRSSTINFGSSTLTNIGNNDIFIVKYNPNGIVLWTNHEGNINSEGISSIKPDLDGNIYVSGGFNSPSLTFGSTTLTNPYIGTSLFTAKYVNDISTNCNALYTIVPDTTTQHHYYLINYATGVSPIIYLWSWGDGTYDSIPYPSHTYTTSGNYTICLTITDATGCISNFCDSSFLQKSQYSIITIDVISNIITEVNSIDEVKQIKIFPNPATDIINRHYIS